VSNSYLVLRFSYSHVGRLSNRARAFDEVLGVGAMLKAVRLRQVVERFWHDPELNHQAST